MTKRTLTLTTTLAMALMLTLLMTLAGCGGKDTGDTGQMGDTTLPQDMGDQTLMDTTTPAEQPIAQKPAEQPIAQKPQEKPIAQKPAAQEQPKPKQPEVVRTVVLDANTQMELEMLTKVSTGESNIGDRFRANVVGPTDKNTSLNLPAGTVVEGVIADLNDGKSEGAKAYIKLKFTDLMMPGENSIPMEGYVVTKDGTGIVRPGDQGTTIIRDAGLGAVAGAVVGAVTGGKGDKTETAAKGAAAGAVIGGVAGALLHKDQVTLKEGTKFDIILAQPAVKETVKP